MPQGHGVDNCSPRFCRRGRQLNLGESRSLTQYSQRNLQPVSRRLWVYVCAFGMGLMVMMVMAIMVKVMVMVMVMVVVTVMVPRALSQVGWWATSTSKSKL